MDINWTDLRPHNSSQNAAFEELCCQLAACEPHPEGSTFIRKAPPDAGIECLWRLPGGDEWGWQAKFFRSPPNTNQWGQIDNSVKKALEKHPRLVSYTICLPIDRSDPRIDQQRSFMDAWDRHVEKWQGWGQEKGMSVEFVYWGEHEIWKRLSLVEHRGRYFFWFSKELFSQKWFKDRVEATIENVGPRYTPELNIELPVAHLFDGLGRTAAFYDGIRALLGTVRKAYTNVSTGKIEEIARDELDSLRECMGKLLSLMENIKEAEIAQIDWSSISDLASDSMEYADECMRILGNAARQRATSSEERETRGHLEDYRWDYWQESVRKLSQELYHIREFAQGSVARLSIVPALLLDGDAGTGKTHLFCDVAKHRVFSDLPTVLLLGEHFNNAEPWSQITQFLHLSCTMEEFLGALEAAAQARGEKALILIDALNEGDGKRLWKTHLPGMLLTLSRYPWISLAVSVRSSYRDLVIREGLVPDRLTRAIHNGFAGHEYQASKTFFEYFGIEHPSVPLLVPEFQNPLFLKTFCKSLENFELTRIPTGLRGITAIFQFFIESIDKKLSEPEYLDFDPRSGKVQDAVEALAEMIADRMMDKGVAWIPRNEAQLAVDALLPRSGYQNSLFRHMISEGLLAEDRFSVNGGWCEGIHFSYERFTDHLVAKHLLDRHVDPDNSSSSFSPDKVLVSLLSDEWTSSLHQGLIEAFCVQLPERIGKELAEVAPECADYQSVREAFVDSLIWRKPEAITCATRDYINQHVLRYSGTRDQFLDALLTVTTNPDHPYNADFLHGHLMRFELAERDSWWSIFLHYQYYEHKAVDRLADWAWSEEDKSHIDDEPIRLCGIALAWFLTTPNRFLRDRATKALVRLLTPRIHVLRKVLSEFMDVNDPYVSERLLAVAYGCAMRSTENSAIGELAGDVYEWIFKNGEPPPHILLRDYARGVVELALDRGINPDVDMEKVRPPYKSKWPSFEIPTEDELKDYGEWQEDMPDEEWARVSLSGL